MLIALSSYLFYGGFTAIRQGRYPARGGGTVDRLRNPKWFWFGVLGAFIFALVCLYWAIAGIPSR